jgi:methionyl-tRNA formyltransferase
MIKPLNVVVITQDDSFAIPGNVEKIARAKAVSLRAVIVLDVKGSLTNKKRYFARGFGLTQTAKMGAHLLAVKLQSVVGKRVGLRQVAARAGVPFHRVEKLHDPSVIELIKGMQPEVIVSFSAPCVFKKSILDLPPMGCINLHCSLLPQYAGLLPSFWALFHNEQVTGATVHYMDDRIDNGAILGQRMIAIPEGTTMYDLIRMTKDSGGDLMIEILEKLSDGGIQEAPNRPEEGSYFSWPTIQQMREFRQRGGRLI